MATPTAWSGLELLYSSPAKVGTETFFRGHSDARYELTPSLLRKWDNGDWQFMPSEDRLCKELLIAHHDEFHGDDYCFDRLVRMQHYGLPTRLLDVSGNPLVALFFACSCKPDQLGIDGEVIVFQVASDGVKYYDSDTVSCLSNLSNLTYAQKNDIDLSLDQDAFNATDVAGKLLHHIKSEKGFFEGRIVPDDLGSIICVKAKRTNTRIKSQSGAFLLFGHEAALPDAGQDGIEISRVTIKNKAHILNQLDRININATTVYPSIDQTAVHLRDQHQSPEPVRMATSTTSDDHPEV
ncbi:FRG domain-containing protein [Paracoccus solventivorans]|uniref:FRG domain-containing protein n=1 Tax=Paracoccus solventivorans TaxID=53463 RepID=UPI00190E7160|nr:FRG domain-containing protein [Paracoccus solventivorans]